MTFLQEWWQELNREQKAQCCLLITLLILVIVVSVIVAGPGAEILEAFEKGLHNYYKP